MSTAPSCRFCDTALTRTFADLGMSPLSNSYLAAEHLWQAEAFYPLHAFVCDECLLVQIPEVQKPEAIFSDYAYFASYSDSWVEHARQYVEAMIERFGFGAEHQVVEIASNDGYLLRHFKDRGVPVLGIEPAANVAAVAAELGIESRVEFFTLEAAKRLVAEGKGADLLIGNNVLAHVPELNDFVQGLGAILKPTGILTMEFPHLVRLVDENQFDTIYHEHFSYFSLIAVERIFAHHGLRIFDVDELPTHGGSLRVYACREGDGARPVEPSVAKLLATEEAEGFRRMATYDGFAAQVHDTKWKLLEFLIAAKRVGKSIVGYGAPAKGNTLLNYCGIGRDLLDYTVDRSPHKQGLYLPGTRIPIHAPDKVRDTRPDYVLILPWNLRDEIIAQMDDVRSWGGEFVVPIPDVRVVA